MSACSQQRTFERTVDTIDFRPYRQYNGAFGRHPWSAVSLPYWPPTWSATAASWARTRWTPWRAGMAACGAPLPESWLDYLAQRAPYKRQEDLDHYLGGLREAGLE